MLNYKVTNNSSNYYAEVAVNCKVKDTATAASKQLDYYKKQGITTSNNSKVIKNAMKLINDGGFVQLVLALSIIFFLLEAKWMIL